MKKYCTSCGNKLEQQARFCTKCGTRVHDGTVSNDVLKNKRSAVTGRSRSTSARNIQRVVIPALVILAAAWVYANLPDSGHPVLRESPVVTSPVVYPSSGQNMVGQDVPIRDGSFVLSLNALRESRFIKFAYAAGDADIPMLAYISPEGKVVTAVSMCEPCNSTSFHIVSNELVCNSCGTKWSANNLEPISGSCGKYPPDAVPNVVQSDSVYIPTSIVSAWQRRI